jgi:hypothetical protein
MWMGGRVNTTAADPRLSLYIMKYIISNSAYLDYLLITQYSIIMLVDIQACSITLIYMLEQSHGCQFNSCSLTYCTFITTMDHADDVISTLTC